MLPLLHTRGVSSSNLLAGTNFYGTGDPIICGRPFRSPPNMNLQDPETENLFSYGTLQTESVQIAIFGRTLRGTPDTLVGYRVIMSATADQDFVKKSRALHHRNLQFTGVAADVVEGTVLTVTPKELDQADTYEPTDYERVSVKLNSGLDAWVYLNRQP